MILMIPMFCLLRIYCDYYFLRCFLFFAINFVVNLFSLEDVMDFEILCMFDLPQLLTTYSKV